MRSLLRLLLASCTVAVPTALMAQPQPPVPLPPQIQVRGALNGATSKSIRLNGQLRSITVTQDGETIAIEDTVGKNITIRRTRTVNGEKRTETFQAPDLETLKKNHPEAAELYRKHTENELNAAQMQAQLQAQLQARQAAGGGFFGPNSFATRPGQGSRKLMSTSRGKSVEIEDQYGENIKIRITDRQSGEPKVREIEAKNPTELQERDAEAAGHYKRLTGDN